ncbi:hypothetical protein SY86_11405 [Erwinia tracheiphila]|uniref:Uncharacterized protein n=2 Tax=Erwinia tracheiphila TaxID=65700 RepID=A0A0M2KF72_9GAMM|nr:hypothetical protein AV903_15120 [Erwinia tracheiphila]EOS93901.1 hypothetical protein ETR_16682 [Erwinia tracheiphila PSU-1]KKF35893.1 hypothetical protein SY86_11405 [Erwinia tracheiphila]
MNDLSTIYAYRGFLFPIFTLLMGAALTFSAMGDSGYLPEIAHILHGITFIGEPVSAIESIGKTLLFVRKGNGMQW